MSWPTVADAGLDTMRKSRSWVSHAVRALGVPTTFVKIVVPWPGPELLTADRSSQKARWLFGCPGGSRLSVPGVLSVLDHPAGKVSSSPGKTVAAPSRYVPAVKWQALAGVQTAPQGADGRSRRMSGRRPARPAHDRRGIRAHGLSSTIRGLP